MGFLQRLRVAIWGEPAETQEERRLIVKLDWFILSFCCLMYWVNYLDRSNLNNAYVSGMKEDLHFKGTELNQINSVFYVGYTLAQVPNNIALQKLSPRIYFSTLMVFWGFLTLGNAFVTNVKQVFVIRFFQACMESATFVGTHYILGSWYKYEELGKRTAIFISAGIAGTLFSGIMQGSIYRNLNGVRGLAGWRWLFIIDFLITMPVAIYGYIVFPGHPTTTTSRFLSAPEKILAVERLPEVVQKRGVLGWSLLKRVGMSWEVYCLSILALLAGDSEMFADNAILNLYLKHLKKYSVEQINYIPTAVSGIAIVANLMFSWYADWFRDDKGRIHVGILLCFTGLISGAIMLNPPSVNAKLFALFLNGVQLGFRSVLFAWANDICRRDDAKRAIVLGFMNAMTIAFYIFWTLLFYNTTQAPMWREGSIAMIANSLAMLLSVASVAWFSYIDKKRAALVEVPGSDAASDVVKVNNDEGIPKALDV